jgi:hypothetical protein
LIGNISSRLPIKSELVIPANAGIQCFQHNKQQLIFADGSMRLAQQGASPRTGTYRTGAPTVRPE